MLPTPVRMMFDDSRRGDDRLVPGRTIDISAKPPVLSRWTIRSLALLGIAGVIYGTLAPFEVDHSRSFSWNLLNQQLVPGDAAANVLLYVPIGLFLRLMFRRRGSWWIEECLASLAVAGLLSYGTELCQTIMARRVACWTDFGCNMGGAAIGILIAPFFQRTWRNQHAWLYHELRVRPYAAAAAAAVILVCAAALLPFDLRPTPGRLAAGIAHIHAAWAAFPWADGWNSPGPIGATALLDKAAAAGAYGLLAFLLALSRSEAGRSHGGAAWYGLTRSVALAAGIELMQLFTVTHVADPRDLLAAWLCGMIGAAIAGAALVKRKRRPEPLAVLRGLTVLTGIWVAARMMTDLLSTSPAVNSAFSWLPLVGSFHRPWDSLLGEYIMAAMHYAALSGAVVLWARSGRRCPRIVVVVAVACATAILGQSLAWWCRRPVDTAHVFLALLAAMVVLRTDRAVFGSRRGLPDDLSSGRNRAALRDGG